MSFDKDFIRGVDLNAAAIEQYGAGSSVRLEKESAWGWKAVKSNGALDGIDMGRAAVKQYNANAKAVLTGVGSTDWVFIDFSAIKQKVIPIVLVTNDKAFDVAGVKNALDCFEGKIIAVQEWIRQQVDKTFDVVQPLVYYTSISSAQFKTWDDQRIATGSFNYYYGVRDEIKKQLGVSYNEKDHIYLVSVFGGVVGWSCNSTPVSLVRSTVFDDKYTIFSQIAHTTSGDTADDMYVIGHELLHAFGLDHTPESTPSRGSYIMWTGRFPNTNLTQDEKNLLLKSNFIK